MIAVHTAQESKNLDSYLIEKLNYSSIDLMENAAKSFVELTQIINSKVVILAGYGNNGGDGLAIGRLLSDSNNVIVCLIGDFSKASTDNLINLELLKKCKCKLLSIESSNDLINIDLTADVIIDSIFGVGYSGNLNEFYSELFKLVNQTKAKKIAVDLPSGLDVKNGIADPNTLKADLTITMFGWKLAFTNKDFWDFTGNIICSELYLDSEIIKSQSNKFIIETEDIRAILPKRSQNTSKFDFGSIVCLCGSQDMPGAAELSSNAAIEIGAGLVYASNYQGKNFVSEVIHLSPISDGIIDLYGKYESVIEKAKVILIGCGLGKNSPLLVELPSLLEKYPNKIFVLDADALQDIHKLKLNSNVILTPHIYEFARISKFAIDDIIMNGFELSKQFAKEHNCNIVLKGATTIITNGEISYFNITGNAGLAKAGSGDVLAGIIAGLASQTGKAIESAALGVYLHSLAADYYVKTYAQETLTASKLITNLKNILPK